MPLTFNAPDGRTTGSPPLIQNYGILVAVNSESLIVEQISANVLTYFGRAAEEFIDQPVTKLAPEPTREKFGQFLQRNSSSSTYLFTFSFHDPSGEPLRCHCHVTVMPGELILLEMEPLIENGAKFTTLPNAFHLIEGSRGFYADLDDPDTAAQHLIEEVKELTGFDRVLISRFQPDFEGEVIAEVLENGLEPLLHLRFPADEYSRRTAAFHMLHRIHSVQDTEAPPCHLVPEMHPRRQDTSVAGSSILQGIPQEGLDALNHIGVRASMTVALVVEGNLWGLIMCHHREPKYIRHEIRSTVGLLAMLVAPELHRIEILRTKITQALKEQELAHLLREVAPFESLEKMLAKSLSAILPIFDADGVAFCDQGNIQEMGSVPDHKTLEEIAQLLDLESKTSEISILSGTELDQHGLAGILPRHTGLISIPFGHDAWLLIFKDEQIKSLRWTRDPDSRPLDPPTKGKVGSPWIEREKRLASPWPPYTALLVDELRAGLSGLLISTNRELSSVNEELRHFANVIAHEVKSQLHTPLMALSLVQEQHPTSKLTPMIDLGVNALTTLSDFTAGLLGFAHSDVNVTEIEEVDLQKIARQTVDQARQTLNIEGVRTEIKDLPTIQASRSQLHHIFLNLIRNSLIHAPQEGQTDLYLEIGKLEGESGIVFYVRDNGKGIPLEEQARIFEYFYRAKGTENRTGSGIGLGFIKRLLERTGGHLWVESEPGQGATFFFSLSGHKEAGAHLSTDL